MNPKIGLFAGGIEQYWTEAGMQELPSVLDADAKKLAADLGDEFDVVYPGLVGNVEASRSVGQIFRRENVDMVLMYHATYVDDAMTIAMMEEIGDIFSVLFHSQGFRSFLDIENLVDAGRSWGNNSAVQISGSLKRVKPDWKFGFVFGALGDSAPLDQIRQYARAARAVKNLKGKRVGVLPHRCIGVPMYDTYPDEAKMMGQTGIEIDFLYIIQLVREMERVSDDDCEELARQLFNDCEVVEPPREEVELSARLALALERLVAEKEIDALAIDFSGGMIPLSGAMPCVGMSRLIDKGVVVSSEGDLAVSVGGLLMRDIEEKPVHFWEHLAFDEEKNWVLGGHEGGSAGFNMAKSGTKPKLRNNQYINWDGIPDAPHFGVVPEFITAPGVCTLLTFFRGPHAYEMRLACGESVDIDPLDVHYEHTVFQPNIPLNSYFRRISDMGVCHHFGLIHARIDAELEKSAEIMGMECGWLTDPAI